MKRLLIVLAAATLLLPGAARAAACSPLDCAPSQFTLGHGTLLAYRHTALGPITVADLGTGKAMFRLPGGFVARDVLVHQAGKRIEWYEATTGRLTGTVTLPLRVRLAGTSQDGSRAVGFFGSTVVIASRTAVRKVDLPGGIWDFDALRGDKLFLIKTYLQGGYQIRLLDLATGKLAPKPLKDPHESGVIWGVPFSRLASPDGRFLFTHYLASNGASMIHELDLVHATARCIDLPGAGDYGSAASWAFALAPGAHPSTLWAVSPGYGKVVAINIGARKVATAFRIDLPYWNLGGGTRIAVGRDGTEIAVADGETVARIALGLRKVVDRVKGRATALGYSPTGRLWTLR
ncbi:MAG: hypothetical protein ACXVRJ_06840 [Gaiellaceae bacterium]